MTFVLDVVHYGHSRLLAEHSEHPPHIREMSIIAPFLLSNQCLIDVDLVIKLEILLNSQLHPSTYAFPHDDKEISHAAIIQHEVRNS